MYTFVPKDVYKGADSIPFDTLLPISPSSSSFVSSFTLLHIVFLFCQCSTQTMASTDVTEKPKQPEPLKNEDKTETAQHSSTDPPNVGHLQQAGNEASKLKRPATEDILQEVTSNDWEYVSDGAL